MATDCEPNRSTIAVNNWTVGLKGMPMLTEALIDDKLIVNSGTRTNLTGPKAYRNKMHGYKLW